MALGFNLVGVIPATPARRLEAYLRWIERGNHGEMGYMARPDRVERRIDPRIILPQVQSILCVGLDYSTQSIPPDIANDPSRGRFSNYAWGQDYHDIMMPRLSQLASWLREKDPQVRSKVYVDTGAILERDHAETAGLGFTAKNTMLIAPRRGSWFFLGELLTTIRLYDEEVQQRPVGCGTCSRCLDACPTLAFPAPYVLDARRCISYLTIELKGWIPLELRPLIGNWVYGCDVCQEVCPFNRFAQPAKERAFWSRTWDDVAPALQDILLLDEEGFARRFANSPVKRIKRSRLLRNACVAAGNWGSDKSVPALVALLEDPDALVRGHAAWALFRIGGRDAQKALSSALKREEDEMVRLELERAF
ncbi:MAG: tRNA epoxyqueuosine(34) reductase QueG [Chloroflexi bacterium]|nr:tRNA epoxyqueuosine(34) reductase QueG [Chloroflexota bacterium]